MDLILDRPLCFYDLETTGTNISKDRIVEISVLKLHPSQKRESKTWLVNPEMPIPKEASDVHGITNEKVANQPTFKTIAGDVYAFMKDADWAGFNSNRFDMPLLAEELLRSGIAFSMQNRQAIDVQAIFHKMEKRTLEAAYKFYCDKNLENAHSAEADTAATLEVLVAQLSRYPNLENNISFLAEFSTQKKCVDLAGFVVYDEFGGEVFGFGKHKGKSVEKVLEQEPGYLDWVQNADFPLYTKQVLASIKLRKVQKS